MICISNSKSKSWPGPSPSLIKASPALPTPGPAKKAAGDFTVTFEIYFNFS